MGVLFSFFVTFVLLSCSRVCLLDVSRLLGLTLRHSAPVCSCHRNSFTRWRLALAHVAARLVSSASSQLFSWSPMCLVISDNLRERSLQAMRTYEGPASLVNLFFTHCSLLCLTHTSRPKNQDTPWGARNVWHLGALSVSSRIGGERITRTYLTLTRGLIFRAHAWLLSSQFTIWQAFCCCCFCGWSSYVRLGLSMETLLDPCSDEQGFANFRALVQSPGNEGCISKTKLRDDAPPAPRPAGQPGALPWEPIGPQDKAYFCERNEAPLPPLRQRCNFIHPRQLSPFPERLKLRFSSDEILSGFEEIVSSGTDQFTAWVKIDPHDTLVHHMVDVLKATADFRVGSERRHDASSQTKRFSKKLFNRSPVEKPLSIYNWNPGPRRGKEDAFEKQIAGSWHVIILQEASEHVDHDFLTGRFHVTHYAGCAILFNKDTFLSNIDVKSIYLHDTRRDLPDQAMEGDQGRVMQGVLSRASFRRPPLSGQETFTVSTYQQHLRQEERHRQEAHPHHPCCHDFSTDWRGCRWLQWYSVAMQQQRQHQYYRRSLCRLRLANAAGPYTTVGTRINSQQLGRRLWIP